MGSKGKIKEGDFRKDYSKVNPLWVTYKLPIKKIKDINYIEEKCSLRFTPLIRKKIRSEILSYTIMNEMQNAAPHKGGSGRVRGPREKAWLGTDFLPRAERAARAGRALLDVGGWPLPLLQGSGQV